MTVAALHDDDFKYRVEDRINEAICLGAEAIDYAADRFALEMNKMIDEELAPVHALAHVLHDEFLRDNNIVHDCKRAEVSVVDNLSERQVEAATKNLVGARSRRLAARRAAKPLRKVRRWWAEVRAEINAIRTQLEVAP